MVSENSFEDGQIRVNVPIGSLVMAAKRTGAGAQRPTIRDVAAQAGVSRGTVSRVLNGSPRVSDAARGAVEAAIERTGYRANHHARSLASGRANSLAFVLTEPHHRLFNDPTFSALLSGVMAALGSRQEALVLLVAGTDAERATVVDYVTSGHVDGVMLISSHEADHLLADLVAAQLPVVSCGIPLGHAGDVAWVGIDEQAAARQMTRHLREAGHRRIAHIAGPADTPGGRYRLVGYRDELDDLVDDDLIEVGDYSRESGTAAMTAILARTRDVDAVFAASDSMAVGAMDALAAAGLRVPEDVSVAGFDDAGLAEQAMPALTTVRQPFAEIAAELVELLARVVDGGSPRALALPTTIVERDSVAARFDLGESIGGLSLS